MKLKRRDLMEDKKLAPVDVVVDGRVEMTLGTSIHPLGSLVEEVIHVFLKGSIYFVLFPVIAEIG